MISAHLTLSVAAALFTLVSAHPGAHEHIHHTEQEVREQVKRSERASTCSASLARRNHALRGEREDSLARRNPGFEARAFYPELQNTTCLLAPDIVEGPYYVNGEQHRNNITETQEGLPFLLDIGLINTATCEPLTGVFVDVWYANSGGYYSGYENIDPITGQSTGDGNCQAGSDPTVGVDDCLTSGTFLRGFYESDANGIVEFASVFPGWYVDRATHIHVKVHVNATLAANGTLVGGSVLHTGQLFFEQDLLTEIYSTIDPYVPYRAGSNQTSNVDDMWFTAQEANGHNAIVQTAKLGASLSDGLVGYITLGIDVETPITSYVNATDVPLYSGNSTGAAVASGSSASAAASTTKKATTTGTASVSASAAAASGTTVGTSTSSASKLLALGRTLALPIVALFAAAV